jgi:predicted RNA-binding Zn-ribbon protein involved in translation (DUF1610 family)
MNIDRSDPNIYAARLLHFHICVHCGSAFRREELEGRAHTTGIFICPKCGAEGPLNLEIREMNESGPDLPKDE